MQINVMPPGSINANKPVESEDLSNVRSSLSEAISLMRKDEEVETPALLKP